ncbi:MAG: sodium:solute symporter family protein [Elusimicrobiota bacterium]|jgi:SSS family solute:Na+ symporter
MLHPLDLGVVFAYLAALGFIGWRAARRRSGGGEDYILAGRSLTLPTFTAVMVTGFYGGVLGVGESAYRYGLCNWLIQGVPYYVFSLLYALFLVGRVRGRSGLTMPDHLESVYGRPVAVFAAFLVFILASPADEVLMVGTLAHWGTGWSLTACVISSALGVSLLLLFGGMRAEAWTGRLEFLFMFGGFALILPFAYLACGGLSYLRANLPPSHLSLTGGNSPGFILTWFFIALWTFVDPGFHQRVCAAKDAATAKRGILLSVCFWFGFDLMTTSAGLYARAMLPGLQDPLSAYPMLADRLLPSVMQGLFFIGMGASTLAALASTSFLSAISLGKDCLGRVLRAPEDVEQRLIRWGLLVAAVLSVFLALALPSVVALWFTVGSVVIPGLLVPMLSSYFESLRMPSWAALLCSAAGSGTAVCAWALGHPAPFYPGLFASLAVWAFSRLRS